MATARPRPLVAGNWKMNGLSASLSVLGEIVDGAADGPAELLVCPPATLVGAFAGAAGGRIAIGGQDVHPAASGAHTGCISAEMLRDAGATYAIVGHSERRADHAETDALVREKALAARRAGLVGIICVGETRAEREAGRALAIVGEQLRGSIPGGATAETLVVAYEPVWAIGTGLTPTPADVAEMHGSIRAVLTELLGTEAPGVRLLYGGSVKPANAAELMAVPDVDGALVGGASLVAADFLAIAAGVPHS
jgi:triosephosphate isomerase (TIM)